jgi:hypothetical protein
LPARTSAFAYVDQRGDLRIWAQDSAYQCDSELRIPAEDVGDFINGLAELVGREPLLEPRSEPVAVREVGNNFRSNGSSFVDAPADSQPRNSRSDSTVLSTDARPLTGAERVRRHREKKRNGCNEGNGQNVTGNAPDMLVELAEEN